MVSCAEGPRRGQGWGRTGCRSRVEARRRQKWSKAILQRLPWKATRRLPVLLAQFQAVQRTRAPPSSHLQTYPGHPAAPHAHHPAQPPTHQSHTSTRTIIAMFGPVHAPATPADVQAAPAVPGGLAGAGTILVRDTAYLPWMQSYRAVFHWLKILFVASRNTPINREMFILI